VTLGGGEERSRPAEHEEMKVEINRVLAGAKASRGRLGQTGI